MPRTGEAQVMGRDSELEILTSLARDAASGRGRLVLIEGEPGIGKTSLLRAFFEDAAALLPRVAIGAAEEFDQRLPFATVGSCLEPLASGDPLVAEVLTLIRDASAEYPVIESVLALVEPWCAAGPVVVAVDDVHWADSASILVLHKLGRVAVQLPLLLVAARRGGAGGPEIDALSRSWVVHGAVQVALGPLPDVTVNRLVAGLVGGQPGPALRGLVSGAAGNPLYIQELVSGLAQGQRLRTTGQLVDVDASSDHLGVSPTLGAAIARRLGFLSPETRELLQVAALLGSAFAVADVAAVLGRPVTDLLGRVAEATDSGLLTALPSRLAFRHPLVRATLADALPGSTRQALHDRSLRRWSPARSRSRSPNTCWPPARLPRRCSHGWPTLPVTSPIARRRWRRSCSASFWTSWPRDRTRCPAACGLLWPLPCYVVAGRRRPSKRPGKR
jgi:predicted ATPase